MSQEVLDACIQACSRCADACDRCAAACLQEPDVTAMAGCIALDIDCAALCRLSAGFMARDSDHARALCRACAEVCNACAEECGQHQADHCRECARACRDCADQCRSMAS